MTAGQAENIINHENQKKDRAAGTARSGKVCSLAGGQLASFWSICKYIMELSCWQGPLRLFGTLSQKTREGVSFFMARLTKPMTAAEYQVAQDRSQTVREIIKQSRVSMTDVCYFARASYITLNRWMKVGLSLEQYKRICDAIARARSEGR